MCVTLKLVFTSLDNSNDWFCYGKLGDGWSIVTLTDIVTGGSMNWVREVCWYRTENNTIRRLIIHLERQHSSGANGDILEMEWVSKADSWQYWLDSVNQRGALVLYHGDFVHFSVSESQQHAVVSRQWIHEWIAWHWPNGNIMSAFNNWISFTRLV